MTAAFGSKTFGRTCRRIRTFSRLRAIFGQVLSVNAHIPPIVEGNAKISATAWLDKNRPITQMTWYPGMPQIIKDKVIQSGGWIDHEGSDIFNLYRAPARISDGKSGEAKPSIDHVRRLYGKDTDHIIDWLTIVPSGLPRRSITRLFLAVRRDRRRHFFGAGQACNWLMEFSRSIACRRHGPLQRLSEERHSPRQRGSRPRGIRSLQVL